MASHIYQRIQDHIREQIAAANGQHYRLPTEREIASAFGTSRPTVSKALAALAADGLLVKPRGGRRYAVSADAARRLSVRRSNHRIGLVIGDLSLTGAAVNELAHRVFSGMNTTADATDCRVLMGSAGSTVTSERAAAHDLVSAGVDGLVIWPRPRMTEEVATDYLRSHELGVPVVLLDTTLPEHRHTQVVFDNRRAGRDMTRWLIARGHRRIALITLSQNLLHTPVTQRRAGYRQALYESGISHDPVLESPLPLEHYIHAGPGVQTDDAISGMVDAWMSLDDPPTAIIALEDAIAMETIDVLRRCGLDVPADIQVVGFDNLEMCRRFVPQFPTTAPDFVRMGELALEVLLEEIEGASPYPRVFVLEAPLLMRSQDSEGMVVRGRN